MIQLFILNTWDESRSESSCLLAQAMKKYYFPG